MLNPLFCNLQWNFLWFSLKCRKGLKGRYVVLYLCLGWSWRENSSCCSNENVKYNNSITFAQYLSLDAPKNWKNKHRRARTHSYIYKCRKKNNSSISFQCNSNADMPVHLFWIVMFSCIVVKMYRALAPYFTINLLCIWPFCITFITLKPLFIHT